MTASPETRTATSGWTVLIVGAFIAAMVVAAGAIQTRFTLAATAAETGLVSDPLAAFAAVEGFRADAMYLPDDPMLGFVEIPGGPFLMGSDPAMDPGAFENERWAEGGGQRAVDLPTFYIGRYEVTVAQYAAFVDATGRPTPPEALRGAPDHPVAWVTWPDALAYGRWLEEQLKASPHTPPEIAARLRDGWRVTIPTEAQWEKAARGTDGRIFPWGNTPARDFANFGSSGVRPVGSFACADCAHGLSDMSGNVWEWTRSPHQIGRYGEDEPRNLEEDALFVMRGGSFTDDARIVRAATRGGGDPGARRAFIGFRVVISPE